MFGTRGLTPGTEDVVPVSIVPDWPNGSFGTTDGAIPEVPEPLDVVPLLMEPPELPRVVPHASSNCGVGLTPILPQPSMV